MMKTIKNFILSVKWSLLFYGVLFLGLVWVNNHRISEEEANALALLHSTLAHPQADIVKTLDYGFSYSITIKDTKTKEEWEEMILIFPYFFEQGKKELASAMTIIR